MKRRLIGTGTALLALMALTVGGTAVADGLQQIRERGVLRHLGIPYANFVTGAGDGMDVELVKGFADYLGVRYQFVPTTWEDAFTDLYGQRIRVDVDDVHYGEATEKKGDMIANGLTVLPMREQVVDYSEPTFPSGIWVIARADASISPITPAGNVETDIANTLQALNGQQVLAGHGGTCVDPRLYDLESHGITPVVKDHVVNLNQMVPAILNQEAQSTLLDVPDALLALQKWPGQIKVIGPITSLQTMAAAFPKDSPALRAAFNDYLREKIRDGTYMRLVQSYYPAAVYYFESYFTELQQTVRLQHPAALQAGTSTEQPG